MLIFFFFFLNIAPALLSNVQVSYRSHAIGLLLELSGEAGNVVKAEFALHKELELENEEINLKAMNPANDAEADRRLNAAMSMSYIFNPLCWRWSNRYQV